MLRQVQPLVQESPSAVEARFCVPNIVTLQVNREDLVKSSSKKAGSSASGAILRSNPHAYLACFIGGSNPET